LVEEIPRKKQFQCRTSIKNLSNAKEEYSSVNKIPESRGKVYQLGAEEPIICDYAYDTTSTDLFLAPALAGGIFYPLLCDFNLESWQLHWTILAYFRLILGLSSLNKCYTSETRSHNYD
jgi:hypothetical protein